MAKRLFILAIVVFFFQAAATARAQDNRSRTPQEVEGLSPGTRVIVVQHDLTRSSGTVLQLDEASLVLQLQGGGERQIPSESIGRITKRDSLRNGALIGLSIGTALGVLGGVFLGVLCDAEGVDCAGAAIGLVALGAGGGAGLGGALDAIGEPTIYLNEPRINGVTVRMPGESSNDLVVQVGRSSSGLGGGSSIDLGVAWAQVSRSGLGFELAGRGSVNRTFRVVECVRESWPLNVEHPCLGQGEEGRAPRVSASAKLHYYLPVPRIQPYVGGGLVYGLEEERFALASRARDGQPVVMRSRAHDGFAALIGEIGVRVVLPRGFVLRPHATFDLGGNHEAIGAAVGIGVIW